MVRGRKEKGTPRIRGNRQTNPRSGISGEFPSLKMAPRPGTNQALPYRGILQREFMYALEFDRQVKGYKPNPFVIRAVGPDGTVYEHTPDFQVEHERGMMLVECLWDDQLDQEATQRDLELASLWSENHRHELLLVKKSELEEKPYLDNLMLLWRYRLAKVPPPLELRCFELLRRFGEALPFDLLRDHLAQEFAHLLGRDLYPKTVPPCLYNMLFRHILQADFRLPLADSSLLWLGEGAYATERDGRDARAGQVT